MPRHQDAVRRVTSNQTGKPEPWSQNLSARIGEYVKSHKGRLVDRFNALDKDHCRSIDVDELAKRMNESGIALMMEELGMVLADSDRSKILSFFDVSDGRITHEDFVNICKPSFPRDTSPQTANILSGAGNILIRCDR